MARYNGSGWHRQSIRHSNARKYGKAGGTYKTFDISTIKGLKKAENFQKNLFKEYHYVEIKPIGFDKVKLTGKKHYGEAEVSEEVYKGITLSKSQRVRERDGKTMYTLLYIFKRSKYPKGEVFYSEKDRDERIKELKETQDYLSDEKQKTKSAQNFTRADVPFKAGDTFETSWGYDQTNYDFIVIKSISQTGKTATCQRAKLSQNKPEGQLMLQKPSKEGYGDTFNMKIKRHTDGGFYLVGTYADGQGHYDGHWRRDTFNQTSPEKEYAETSPEFGH